MNGEAIRSARRRAGWTQQKLAGKLGVTQAYLSLMERGRRAVPDRVARSVIRLLKLPPTALPFPDATSCRAAPDPWIEQALARLGYPRLAYLSTPGRMHNPSEVLLRALAHDDLDPRLLEALPWLLLRFEEFDVGTLLTSAKLRDLQNRLGFTIALAREIAEHDPRWRQRADQLRGFESALEPSRLVREDTYCANVLSDRMRDWLRDHRSEAAVHWNLLTDLKMEHLSYVGEDQGTVARLPS